MEAGEPTAADLSAGDSPGKGPLDSDEEALLARLKAGDADAYESLVRAHTGRLLAVAKRYLRNDDDAQDAVQEAFLSAFRAIDRFEGASKLSTWLHRITVNACLMKLRTRRRKPEESIEEMLPRFHENGHLESPRGGFHGNADHLLERRENREAVREAIAELPEKYRTVLLLRDIEEYDTDATAEALGMTKAAVKTRLHRARLALRTQLDERFGSGAG